MPLLEKFQSLTNTFTYVKRICERVFMYPLRVLKIPEIIYSAIWVENIFSNEISFAICLDDGFIINGKRYLRCSKIKKRGNASNILNPFIKNPFNIQPIC
jgi:hypothetical protein